MMKTNSVKLLVFVAFGSVLLGAFLALLLSIWLGLSQPIAILIVIAFLLFGVGFVLGPMLRFDLSSAARMAEDVQVIIDANPAHRLSVTDLPEHLRPLAEAVNALAEHYQQTVSAQEGQIEQAADRLQDEKDKLAALIEELTEGIVVCNMQGRILLFNSRASALLSHDIAKTSGDGPVGFVGLGRSIFGVMDRDVLVNAAKSIMYRFEQNGGYQPTQLVIVAANGNMLRVRLIPIVHQQQELDGFILSLDDVNRLSEASRHQYQQIESTVKTVQASLAEIQTTAGQMTQTPAAQLSRLQDAIISQAASLNRQLEQMANQHAASLNLFDWRMDEILGSDLLWAIRQAAEDQLNLTPTTKSPEAPVWLRADSSLLVQLMIHLMQRLKDEFKLAQIDLTLTPNDSVAALELSWSGRQAPLPKIQSWQNETFSTPVTAIPVSPAQVAEVHGGQIQWQADEVSDRACMKLLLPTTSPKPVQVKQVSHGSRPEFYDFDLFHQIDESAELAQRPLAELTFTVFDTETTGLHPAKGDEITSVSGIRIVNKRLLHQETFDQLVDPQRPLPRQSIEITGITPEMVAGQPTIEQVLPQFYYFAEDTVLAAHNAAFDMRCFELKEEQTGVKFTQPVVDTLLLSAVLHPDFNDHSLEAIADRFGLNIIGRHSSLGDSIVTGEVLLKLIPLLAEKGIVTLGQALHEAQKSYLARLKY
ncbi:MAG: DNA polymerase III subunit epsilon [Anaerolineales bacterium]|nr:DNA polymerase III subunit epsilon [Anaerolineales bacterium]